jgi:hypothetical protein
MREGVLPLGRFYQFGYVTKDLEAAAATLRTQFGIERFRRKRNAEWMEALHAWTGDTQIEVLQLGQGAPQMYLEYIPAEPGKLRLQHLGRHIDTLEEWECLEKAVAKTGLDTPLRANAMDGQLRALYVDTRDLLGIYSEYVYLSGGALNMYDDIPQNNPTAKQAPLPAAAPEFSYRSAT